MDRNSAIGFILIAAILVGYTWYTMPTAEERAAEQHRQDSIAHVESERRAADAEQRLQEGTARIPAAPEPGTWTTYGVDPDSVRRAQLHQQFGIMAGAAEGEEREVVIQNDRVHVTISTLGARPLVMNLKGYRTFHGGPLLLAEPDSNLYEFRFFLGNLDISTRQLYFQPEILGPNSVRLRTNTGNPGRYVQITYTLDDSASYFMNVHAEFVGMQQELDPRNLFFHWDLVGRSNEKYRPAELQKSSIYFKYFNDDRDYLSESDPDEKRLNGRTNWVAFKQDFFTVAMVSNEGFASSGSEITVTPLEDERYTKRYQARLYFDKERSPHLDIPMRLYLGPNHYNTLRATDIDQFDRIIDLGWGIFGWVNRFIVIFIFNLLNDFDLSYGIIIFVLTLVIKMLLMPLTYKNFVASARMRVLKPEIDALNEKHKDADPLKKQQATMELYRKAGVNPASGCVPMLVQLPILYAMFRFFPASIELRQESFLWADDLSSYDSILDLPFTIPMYGDHVSLFTLLMAASTIVYSLINQQQMPQQQGMPSMKLLLWMFPIMMLFFLNNFSSGLSYYYLLANLISILQMTLLKHWFVDEGKLRAQLLQNMKTPKKKSRWQQRLEDMQKQQQVAAKKRK